MADRSNPTASRTARLAAFFRAHPNTWHDGAGVLSAIGGQYAWRTRVAEVRTQHGLPILNRQRRVCRDDGSIYTVSEYGLFGQQRGQLNLPGALQ